MISIRFACPMPLREYSLTSEMNSYMIDRFCSESGLLRATYESELMLTRSGGKGEIEISLPLRNAGKDWDPFGNLCTIYCKKDNKSDYILYNKSIFGLDLNLVWITIIAIPIVVRVHLFRLLIHSWRHSSFFELLGSPSFSNYSSKFTEIWIISLIDFCKWFKPRPVTYR